MKRIDFILIGTLAILLGMFQSMFFPTEFFQHKNLGLHTRFKIQRLAIALEQFSRDSPDEFKNCFNREKGKLIVVRSALELKLSHYFLAENGEMLTDAWGFPLIIRECLPSDSPALHAAKLDLGEHSLVIYSVGRNGVDDQGKKDDIVNDQ